MCHMAPHSWRGWGGGRPAGAGLFLAIEFEKLKRMKIGSLRLQSLGWVLDIGCLSGKYKFKRICTFHYVATCLLGSLWEGGAISNQAGNFKRMTFGSLRQDAKYGVGPSWRLSGELLGGSDGVVVNKSPVGCGLPLLSAWAWDRKRYSYGATSHDSRSPLASFVKILYIFVYDRPPSLSHVPIKIW